jgi:hypothetical protein
MDKEFVAVDEKEISEMAATLAMETPTAPNFRTKGIFPKKNKVFVNHLLYMCAVDFCFWLPDPKEKYEVDGFTGSMAMGRCFHRHFGEDPISPEEMMDIVSSYEKAEKFFRGKNLPQLLQERRENLLEVATVLKEKFNGDPNRILWIAGRTARNYVPSIFPDIVSILVDNFPVVFGSDSKFHKRAQLFCLMYQGRAWDSETDDQSLRPLNEFEGIGPVIDYQIPRALRHLGILKYSDDLAYRVDNYATIPEGSEEEFEIRAAAVYAVAELLKKLQPMHWTMLELDNWLLEFGRKCPKPHHRTLTTKY